MDEHRSNYGKKYSSPKRVIEAYVEDYNKPDEYRIPYDHSYASVKSMYDAYNRACLSVGGVTCHCVGTSIVLRRIYNYGDQ